MAKYGSPSFQLLLIGGRSALSATSEVNGPEIETLTEETTPPGASFFEHLAVGLRKITLSWAGWYEDAENAANEAFLNGQTSQQVTVIGLQGNTVGKKFIGLEGLFSGKYRRIATRNALHRASADLTTTGKLDDGVILQPLAQQTVDWDTEGATSQDAGASSVLGGAAHLQVTELTGITGFVGKIRHSADDTTYADLVTFDNVTAAPAAQRKTVAVGVSINRHLAFSGDVTGTGTITAFGGFARG